MSKDQLREIDRFSNLNQREIQIIICVCLARDGYICKKCKTTIQELLLRDKIKREIKQLPSRIKPIVVINHLDGTKNTHTPQQLFGNVELVCYACNRLYEPPQVDYRPDEIRTYASRKSHEAYVKWVRMVDNYLTKFEVGCLARLANKYSKVIKCSQDALIKYAKREHETRWSLFVMNCDYLFCSGYHICRWGTVPPSEPLDQDVAEEEDEP